MKVKSVTKKLQSTLERAKLSCCKEAQPELPQIGYELLKQTFGRDAETARRDGETTRRDSETRRQEFMFSGSLSLPEKVPSFAV